jgi:hypothetical protein
MQSMSNKGIDKLCVCVCVCVEKRGRKEGANEKEEEGNT